MNTQSIKIALAAVALSTLAMGTTVRADNSVPQVSLDTKAYDLGNPADLARIKGQITSAARSVCGLNTNDGNGSRNVKMVCFRRAMAEANVQLEAQIAATGNQTTSQIALKEGHSVPVTKR